jgi:Na+/proline symporter
MKAGFPKKKMDGIRIILFPFKCYIIIAPVILLLLINWSDGLNADSHHLGSRLLAQTMLAVHIYVVCIVVLIVGAVISIFTRDWKSILWALIYAVIGFALLAFLLPAIAPSK